MPEVGCAQSAGSGLTYHADQQPLFTIPRTGERDCAVTRPGVVPQLLDCVGVSNDGKPRRCTSRSGPSQLFAGHTQPELAICKDAAAPDVGDLAPQR